MTSYLMRYSKEQGSKVIVVGYPSLGISFWTCVAKPVFIILLPARKPCALYKEVSERILLDPILKTKVNGILKHRIIDDLWCSDIPFLDRQTATKKVRYKEHVANSNESDETRLCNPVNIPQSHLFTY